jgi:hypothetical protein
MLGVGHELLIYPLVCAGLVDAARSADFVGE